VGAAKEEKVMRHLLYGIALIFYMQAMPFKLVAISAVVNAVVLVYKYYRGESW